MLFVYWIAFVMIMLCYYEAVEASERKKNELFLYTHTLQWPGTMKQNQNAILKEQLFKNVMVFKEKNLIRYQQFFMEANIHIWCC